MDRVGLFSFLFDRGEGQRTTILAEISLDELESRKVVTLRSQYLLMNHTDHSLMVSLGEVDPHVLGTIRPQGHLALPADFSSKVPIKLRPLLKTSENVWCDPEAVFFFFSPSRTIQMNKQHKHTRSLKM